MWFFASCIIFFLVIGRIIRSNNRRSRKSEQDFWEREREANSVRRKPLDDLAYIIIPLEQLPVSILSEHETVRECLEIINSLAKQKIVNLTGYSNTDLKFMYGAPNITVLTEYDQNYTMLVRTLQKWAEALLEAGYISEARSILEFAVSIKTDVSKTYYVLAKIYSDCGEPHRIHDLAQTAETLNSAQKNTLIRNLKETYPFLEDQDADS
jgi:tetratricopeptide (TPR) repeat protein